jgi:putative molybdopterin biosynthesis protein
MELMTTAECAAYLRLKERSLYDLVARQQIPCTRATGKLLFPKALIDRWLEAQTDTAGTSGVAAPPIYAGSSEPLLEWSLRESQSGLAVLACGSLAGLDQLAARRACLAGLHLPPADAEAPASAGNIAAIRARLSLPGIVAIRFATRRQGLLVARGNPLGLEAAADLARPGLRLAVRPPETGSAVLLQTLLAGLDRVAPAGTTAAQTEADLAALVADGRADCGLGVEAVAKYFGIDFVPLVTEAFDLVMRRRDYFEPAIQRLVTFTRSPAFAAEAERLGGYALGSAGEVVFNT